MGDTGKKAGALARLAETKPLLFVYGTLRQGEQDAPEMQKLGAQFLGEATTEPFYRLDNDFLEPGQDSVRGQLYQVDPHRLGELDRFELHDYQRVPIRIENLESPVWAYMRRKG